jgi:hypothetical protein
MQDPHCVVWFRKSNRLQNIELSRIFVFFQNFYACKRVTPSGPKPSAQSPKPTREA